MVLTNRAKQASKSQSSDSNDEAPVMQAEKLKREVNELKTDIKKV